MTKISWIIVYRNPTTDHLHIIENSDPDGESARIAEYETEDAAYEAATKISCCLAWGAEIIPVGS